MYGPPDTVLEYVLYPITDDVLPVQDKETEWLAVATPVPESVMLSGEFVALLATATVPVMFPAADGVNVAVSVAVCPGVRMRPPDTPLALKPAPETVTLDTVTLEFPALVSVTVLGCAAGHVYIAESSSWKRHLS